MNDIKIKAVLNGWIVTVGCQKVVFKSIDKLCDELKAYYADPEGVEMRYLEKSVNAKLLNPNADSHAVTFHF